MYNQNEGVAIEWRQDDFVEPVDLKQETPKGQVSSRPKEQRDERPWGGGPGEKGHSLLYTEVNSVVGITELKVWLKGERAGEKTAFGNSMKIESYRKEILWALFHKSKKRWATQES